MYETMCAIFALSVIALGVLFLLSPLILLYIYLEIRKNRIANEAKPKGIIYKEE